MFFSLHTKPPYMAMPEAEYTDGEIKAGDPAPRPRWQYRRSTLEVGVAWLVGACVLTGLVAAIAAVFFLFVPFASHCAAPAEAIVPRTCIRPAVRREWRTLGRDDRDAYIAAVQCLSTRPSRLYANGSLYDDFPRVHQETAPAAHRAAPFLPWHRYYIHSYETALKHDCSYGGVLPYWDWSQDWQNFEGAPVWASAGGFGGDGDAAGDETVGGGRCVTDGPFAGLQATYYADAVRPHCLSRGFAAGADMDRLASLISPAALEDLARAEDSFERFAPELERRAHTFIRDGVRGDFSAYTGPYDPVFFLHHANLDRLWAQWQAAGAERQNAYGGPSREDAAAPFASLFDSLSVGGLLPDVQVSEVMEITAGTFCYQY